MKASAILRNSFDVQVDSNHRWSEDRVLEVTVYPLSIDADGEISTDTFTTLAHIEIPNQENLCEDTWISSENVTELENLPERWQDAVRKALELADAAQATTDKPMRYEAGQTVFLTEYRFPGDVENITTDGRYVIQMANSGVIDIFEEDELEPYDYDRWNS